MNTHLRPLFATAGAALLAVVMAGCSSGPFASKSADGRYFQYLTTDDKVTAEYATPDGATCQRHLANLKRGNAHGGPEAGRCSATSMAAQLPVNAAVRDSAGADYTFRFGSLDQCRRMMQAIASQGTVTRACQ